MRRMAMEEDRRADGRACDEVRPISSRAGLLPCTHGSALFTRGETQTIAVTTLGACCQQLVLDSSSPPCCSYHRRRSVQLISDLQGGGNNGNCAELIVRDEMYAIWPKKCPVVGAVSVRTLRMPGRHAGLRACDRQSERPEQFLHAKPRRPGGGGAARGRDGGRRRRGCAALLPAVLFPAQQRGRDWPRGRTQSARDWARPAGRARAHARHPRHRE